VWRTTGTSHPSPFKFLEEVDEFESSGPYDVPGAGCSWFVEEDEPGVSLNERS